MNEFLSKIENFLFDIFGLVLPGLILILLIVLPAYFLGFNTVPPLTLSKSNFLSFLHFLHQQFSILIKYKPGYLLFGLLLSSYILGHLLKVGSIVMYDFLTALFDETINPILIRIKNWFLRLCNKVFIATFSCSFRQTTVYSYLQKLLKPIHKHFFNIFWFRGDPYMPDNDSIKTETVNIINAKLSTNFPIVWYSLYKIGTVTLMQENVRNLSNFFLSKYNLYRSLSLITILSFIYYLEFFKVTEGFVTTDLHHFKKWILWLLIALWYTFHHKYKRYWTLCGNETLMSLYYFLNKDKLKQL